MEGGVEADSREKLLLNPSNGRIDEKKKKKKAKVVVIMGPTGSGKSKLAVDLASRFPIEIINADSMQVYGGLDVLTNKVPLDEQKGVPHHLMGTVSPNVEFTAKDFRDSAIPLIEEILSRNHLPVLVGGTNYYIQSLIDKLIGNGRIVIEVLGSLPAYCYWVLTVFRHLYRLRRIAGKPFAYRMWNAVVSRFLLDDSAEDIDESHSSDAPGNDEHMDTEYVSGRDGIGHGYDLLKELDPVAANRIHPNNHRKINQYLSLYTRLGVLPSKLFQGKAAENWGQVDNFTFDCCFICIDVAIPVLDRYVGERVDCMVDAGLLGEVYDIYKPGADYTRGLRQAIGVREFEDFLKISLSGRSTDELMGSVKVLVHQISESKDDKVMKENLRGILNLPGENKLRILLEEAIDRVKLNTRRLLRRQKRRVNRLETLFGWNIHHVDATESISSKSEETWAAKVVTPASEIVQSFLTNETTLVPHSGTLENHLGKSTQRDLWTQYVCKACGDKVLRGSHEWEQHKQGRAHRKRTSRLKKARDFNNLRKQEEQIPPEA